jgi:hypothetical protein
MRMRCRGSPTCALVLCGSHLLTVRTRARHVKNFLVQKRVQMLACGSNIQAKRADSAALLTTSTALVSSAPTKSQSKQSNGTGRGRRRHPTPWWNRGRVKFSGPPDLPNTLWILGSNSAAAGGKTCQCASVRSTRIVVDDRWRKCRTNWAFAAREPGLRASINKSICVFCLRPTSSQIGLINRS